MTCTDECPTALAGRHVIHLCPYVSGVFERAHVLCECTHTCWYVLVRVCRMCIRWCLWENGLFPLILASFLRSWRRVAFFRCISARCFMVADVHREACHVSVCLYAYMCLYVHTYVSVCVWAYTCMHEHACVRMREHMCTLGSVLRTRLPR